MTRWQGGVASFPAAGLCGDPLPSPLGMRPRLVQSRALASLSLLLPL